MHLPISYLMLSNPVNVVLHPEQILLDTDCRTWFDEFDQAERELERRENRIRPSFVYLSGRELSETMQEYYADIGVQIIEGSPPPLPTVEELEAAFAAERDNPTELTADEQAAEEALATIDTLRQRLLALQRAELAEYGERLAHAVRERLQALALPVPINVTVDVDAPSDGAPETPLEAWAVGAIDTAIARCRLPGEWDHFRAGFAMSMGPPVCH